MDTLDHRQPVIGRTKIAAGIGIGIILVIALGIVTLFPPYQPLTPTGSYNVTTIRYTFVDQSRIEEFDDNGKNRKVNVVFWFPENAKDDETHPLVVFSHGGLGSEGNNESLYLDLASQGYVVCSIGHPYHALWTRDADGQVTIVSKEYFKDIQQEDAKRDKEQSYRFYQEWMKIRTGDINFVIDTILTNVKNNKGGVYSLIETEKIGVMGHSLGGSAALAIPRLRDDVDAVIALEAPFLYDIIGVEKDEFMWTNKLYPIPMLNIYSDSSWDHLSEWSQYGRNYEFLSNASEEVINLHLPGRGHFSLTDLSLASPVLVRMLEGGQSNRGSEEYLKAMNKACLDFFDRYLKDLDG